MAENESQSQSGKKGGDSKKKIVVGQSKTAKKGGTSKTGVVIGVLASVVILVLIGVIIFLLVPREGKKEASATESSVGEEKKRDVLVTEDNVQEVVEQMEEANRNYVVPGYYTATMNYDWHFPDGKSASTDSYVKNVEENINDVYFNLYMAGDESNILYESPVIPRGKVLEHIVLDKPLEKGTYDCVVEYHTIDEEQNTLGTVSFAVKLFVEN